MKRTAFLLSLQVLILFSLSCTRDLPEAEQRSAGGAKEITIAFTLPGDDFPSPEDMELRDAVAAAIAAEGVGEVTRRASGMGFMEIDVLLREEGTGISAVKKILFDSHPGARYRIER